MFKVAPLHSSFMLVSMFGFIFSVFFLTHPIFKTWAWTFMIAFVIMFIASMISMSKASVDNQLHLDHLDHLAIHKKDHYKRKKR